MNLQTLQREDFLEKGSLYYRFTTLVLRLKEFIWIFMDLFQLFLEILLMISF